MRPSTIGLSTAACALSGLVVMAVRAQAPPDAHAWNAKAAAAYLDGRAAWWSTWPNAARDHGTFCVSCHTAVPYVLARPALRAALGERDRTPPEQALVDNVVKRVTLWKEVAPFYPDQLRGLPKTSESRGTEAILNALILATRDASSGHLGPDARAAFDNMWALQMRIAPLSGAWAWLDFHYEPWESTAAPYVGASLAALAVGTAPDAYASTPDIQDNIKRLREYFQKEYEHQSTFNRLMAVWASTKIPGLLSPEQRQATIDAALAKQQDDGGWSIATLGPWKRLDGTALDTRSDGFATGLVTLVLLRAGVAAGSPAMSKGLGWLKSNQDPATGQWWASSLNKQRDPTTDAGRFMSDAATAYAVLSLTYAR